MEQSSPQTDTAAPATKGGFWPLVWWVVLMVIALKLLGLVMGAAVLVAWIVWSTFEAAPTTRAVLAVTVLVLGLAIWGGLRAFAAGGESLTDCLKQSAAPAKSERAAQAMAIACRKLHDHAATENQRSRAKCWIRELGDVTTDAGANAAMRACNMENR